MNLLTVVPPSGEDHAFRIAPEVVDWHDLAEPPDDLDLDEPLPFEVVETACRDLPVPDDLPERDVEFIEGHDWRERSIVRWSGGWTLLVGLRPDHFLLNDDLPPAWRQAVALLGLVDGIFLPNEEAAELEYQSGSIPRPDGRGFLHRRAVPAADWLVPHGGPPLATPARAPRWRWLRTREDRVVEEFRPSRAEERGVPRKWDATWADWLLPMEVWRIWESCRCGIETPQFDPLSEVLIDPHDLTEARLSTPRVERYGPPVEPVLTRVLTRAKREDLLHHFRGMSDVPPELAAEVRARAENRAVGAAAGSVAAATREAKVPAAERKAVMMLRAAGRTIPPELIPPGMDDPPAAASAADSHPAEAAAVDAPGSAAAAGDVSKDALRAWVESPGGLKGKQKAVLTAVLDAADAPVPLRDLAAAADWPEDCKSRFNDLRKAVNPKLEENGFPWELGRQNGAAVLRSTCPAPG